MWTPSHGPAKAGRPARTSHSSCVPIQDVSLKTWRKIWTIEKNKSKATFIQFDIIDFYPSITKNILIDSINYARKYIDITNEQYEIILACRKIVIKNNESTWVKSGLDNFDVPVGWEL